MKCLPAELQGDLDMALIWERVVPVLVRVLLIRCSFHYGAHFTTELNLMCVPVIVSSKSSASVFANYKPDAVPCRPGSHLAREAVLEAAWICTNLACAGPEPASAVLAAAPVLILHLDCAHSYEVAEQCAWALGKTLSF